MCFAFVPAELVLEKARARRVETLPALLMNA